MEVLQPNDLQISRCRKQGLRILHLMASGFNDSAPVCHGQFALAHELLQLFHGQRAAEVIALHLIAFLRAQKIELLRGFHAFCDYHELQTVR